MSEPPRLQVYGQPWERMPAKIVGNYEGLQALRDLIGIVLGGARTEHEAVQAFDGEPYSLMVERVDTAHPLHYTCVERK